MCNATGNNNTAIGACAMLGNFGSGSSCRNTAVGISTLRRITTGCNNTAVGACASSCNCTGRNITAVGYNALRNNTAAFGQTAVGSNALRWNTTGCQNTAIGYMSLNGNTTGQNNTALGQAVLYNNYTGSFNSAIGDGALYSNSSGCHNVGVGICALLGNCSGDYNVAIGNFAMGYNFSYNNNCNIAIGYCTGFYSTGFYTNVNNTIQIGHLTYTSMGCNNHTVWGNSSNNVCNCVYAAWSNVSDRRDKTNINELPDKYGIDFVRKLKPVSYKWDHRDSYVRECACTYGEKDGSLSSSKCHYGFIAQDIKSTLEELNITFDGLGYDQNKDAYRLTYEEMIAPIVKSIKQLIDRVELLENDNKALNERVKILEQA